MGLCNLIAINDKGAEYIQRLGTVPRHMSKSCMDAYNQVLLSEGVQYVSRQSDSKRIGSLIPTTKVL